MELRPVHRRRLVWSWLLPVLLLTGLVRLPALTLPHFRGDEPAFLGLSAKVADAGLSDYNLRHADVIVRPLPNDSPYALMTVTRGPQARGALIRYFAGGGEDYHDRQISNYSALHPAVVALSQKLIGHGEFTLLGIRPEIEQRARASGEYVRVRTQVYQRAARRAYPGASAVARLQLYAVLPSILGSLLMACGVFWLTWQLTGSPHLATLASLFATTAPVEILAGHLVQSDALGAGLAALGLATAHAALVRLDAGGRALAVAAGAVLSLGVLTKPHVALVGVGYGAAELFLLLLRPTERRERLVHLAAFSAVAILISLPWVLWVGSSSAVAEFEAGRTERGPFGEWVRSRPWWIYPFNLLHYSPALLLGLAALRRPRRLQAGVLLCCAVVAVFCVVTYFYPGRECRYLLPAYPALAALGALGARRLLRLLSARFGDRVARALVGGPIALLLLRSMDLGALAAREGLTHWSAEALYGL